MTNEKQNEKDLLGRVIYRGTHSIGWVDKFLNGTEIADSMRQARILLPNRPLNIWLSSLRRERPVSVYRGRHSIANGGSLSGGTDGEVFEYEGRYIATAGIYLAEINGSLTDDPGLVRNPDNIGLVFHCVTDPKDVTNWYSWDTWQRILNQ